MSEQGVLEALQELCADREGQRVLDQPTSCEDVQLNDPRHASLTQNYLGLSARERLTSELILGYDRVVWKLVKTDSGRWELEEWGGYDEAKERLARAIDMESSFKKAAIEDEDLKGDLGGIVYDTETPFLAGVSSVLKVNSIRNALA
jgi:hypothetical protein